MRIKIRRADTSYQDRLRFYRGDVCKKCHILVTIKNKSGYCRSCRMLGNKNTLGWKMPDKQKKHLSVNRISSLNPNWKADNVGYNALHGWVKRHIVKSELCNHCNKVPPLDLANKGTYDRNFNNWEWLCRRCHMISDGRLEAFRNAYKNKKSRHTI